MPMTRQDLIDARQSRNLTQAQLAELVGIDQGRVSKIEKGRQSITVELAPELARALGLDVLQVLYPQAKAA